uniref:Cleavage and polyadenylation specificity factor subunit 6 n=2 Tax=Phlebotomus papatasi TaxID=29031 RepID=A0A1B0DBJ3_PHLPP
MADASIDLYADDLDQDYNQKDDFGGDGVDLYDDVLTSQPGGTPRSDGGGPGGDRSMDRSETSETNGGYHHIGNNLAPNHMGRRYQLYIGNLNWWTTDQDIADVIEDIGVKDFQDVKFFENRANGQSKGFCVITLGSESSMRLTMDRLPKKTMHGQIPMVTPATKQALNQFESQQKTRPNPPPSNGPRGPPSSMGGPPPHSGGPPPGHQPRMMNPNGPPHIRGPPQFQGQRMPGGPPGQPGGPGGPRM